MKIAIDAMGGDYAPRQIVEGIIDCMPKLDNETTLILVGKIAEVKKCFEGRDEQWGSKIQFVEAEHAISMDESPIIALKTKPNNSITIATKLVADGKADAVLSAGNTGVMVGSASLQLGKLPGVQKAGIAAVFPTSKQATVVMDVGANVNCRPPHLVQYAAMGGVFYSKLFNKPKPRVALLSVGAESTKGNDLVKDTSKIFEKNKDVELPFEFAGRAEGHNITNGEFDVVICDGFVGNVVLKLTEALNEHVISLVKNHIGIIEVTELQQNMLFSRLSKEMDWAEHGGAQLLGVNGTTVIAHGRSSPRAISNAIRICAKMILNNVQNDIKDAIQIVNSQMLKKFFGVLTRKK